MEAEFRVICFKDGGMGHKPRNEGSFWKLEKKTYYSLKSPEGM